MGHPHLGVTMRYHSVFTSLVALAACCFTPSGRAAQMTVGDLRAVCAGSDEGTQNACRLYILGVTEGLSLGAETARANSKVICVPEGVSGTQMVLLLKSKMDADLTLYPKDTELAAVGFVAAVMIRQYPCSTKKR